MDRGIYVGYFIPMDGGSYQEGYKVISLCMEGAIRRITRSYPYGLGIYEGYKVISPIDGGGAIRRVTRLYPYGWRDL